MFRVVSFVILLAVLVPQGVAAQLYQVGQVVIEGNRRVESRYIKSALNISEGQTVSATDIDQGLRNIYATGRFDNVTAETVTAGERVNLVYRVTERPLLREVVFVGNHEIDNDKLSTIINAKSIDFFRPQVLAPAIKKIKQAYVLEGFYATEVVPQVDINDRNEVTLTLDIEEGERVFVTSIRFEGNTVFSEKELKKKLFSKEKWFLSFITERGAYKEDMLLADRDVITDQYYNQGYIKVQVKKPITTLLADKESMEVLFEIEEGEQFRIGEVDVQGDLLGSKEEMLAGLTLRSGEVFSRKVLRENMKQLNDLYADEGYAFVNVSPVTDVDPFLQQINIVLNVERGVRVSIGRISVAGNTRTRDKVVRREMRLTEGDFYSASKMKNSRRRINNLGFFEEVNLTTSRGVDDAHMDVEIDVQEKATGSFSVGAGFSSADGLLFQGSVSQDNFLGRALRFDLSAALGGSSTTYRLGLLDPYFLDKHIAFGGDLYNTEREWSDFTRKTTGGDVKLGVPLTETMRSFFIYRFEKKDIFDVDDDAPRSITEQKGKHTLSSFTASLSRNTTDYRPDPTRGNISELSIEYAGLGGTEKFIKYIADHRYFYPLPWGLVFSAHGQVGYIQEMGGQDSPLDERFFLGGMNSLRGFESREVGPYEIDDDGEIYFYGGNKEAYFNLEVAFPLVKAMKMKGLVFFDTGNSWDKDQEFFSDMRYSAGVGMAWNSPMGPLRFAWGRNLDPEDYEETSVFDFSVGKMF
ncbi:outer membrane protein assembly factor BamA [Syntrophotalea acetylenivorans]|uniref:Outer membrane protein assembly factor BamA n=1 Tax=Syntrophotalea acetylenivorans TaxID=1842532 RepID=A0A1L3GL27_9BACT|nr:outer membrane protein assembly factor BamA [Syntrophotalea acetylenivorans]APG26624.1 outer membrane protein assembly factor BamA [Syntrophotalea acetylenivorans]